MAAPISSGCFGGAFLVGFYGFATFCFVLASWPELARRPYGVLDCADSGARDAGNDLRAELTPPAATGG
jgi:hypothetical protein